MGASAPLETADQTVEMLSRCVEAILRATSETALLEEVCHISVATGGYRLASVFFVIDGSQEDFLPAGSAGVDDGFIQAVSAAAIDDESRSSEPAGRVIRSGQPVVVADITAERSVAWVVAAVARGYRSCAVFPLTDGSRTFGAFALYSVEIPIGSDSQQRLLRQIADSLAFGILKLRAETDRGFLLDAIRLVAKTSAQLTGTRYLQALLPALVDVVGAHAGFIAESATSGSDLVRPLCAVVDGRVIPDFSYSLGGTPCADVPPGGRLIIARGVCARYPTAGALAALGSNAYAGVSFVGPDGENIGTIFVLFRKPLKRAEFVGSVLDLFANRVAAEIVRWRADMQLREQAMLLDQAQDAIFLCTLDHRIVHWNLGASRLYGWSAAEVIGRSVLEFKITDPEAFRRATDHCMHAGEWTGDQVEMAKDGRRLTVECHWTLMKSEDGTPVGRLAINKDVTRQRAEEQRLRLLETAVARLNDIIIITEAAPINEPGPRIVYANEAVQHRTGYSSAELIGRSPRLFQGPDTSPAERMRIREALQNHQPVRAELINYKRNGDAYWLELDIAPVVDAEGLCTHFVSVQRDITDRKRADERWRESEARLVQSQKLEAIGQLTGGIAHDFNNILTVIIGSTESLVADLATHPSLSELAQMAMKAGQRGAELTNRLLAFARKQALEPLAFHPNSVLLDMLPLLRQTLGEHIRIDTAQGAASWPVFVDRGQLEAAVLNLCINARDAMPGGGSLTLETTNTYLDDSYCKDNIDVQPGEYVMVAVSDTGTGIDREVLARVFDPFFTTKPEGKGSGLGLSMVYGFIKQSGGHVKIYSEVGTGTAVKMYLPRANAKQLEAPQESASSADVEIGGEEVILLVEDDEMVADNAVRLLRRQGYRVLQATDGAQALEIVDSGVPIDLLFTDVVLSGSMNGAALAIEIVKRRIGISVLFTSGYTENAIVHHNRVDPGVLLLHKPYTRRLLLEKVREALGSAHQGRQN